MRLLLDWGAAVDKVWGNHSDVESFHSPPSSKTCSPPPSWVKNTSSPALNPSSPLCDDFEDTLSDLMDVKEEKIDYKIKTTAKKRKSKSPKFSVGLQVLFWSAKAVAGCDEVYGQGPAASSHHHGGVGGHQPEGPVCDQQLLTVHNFRLNYIRPI